MPSRRVVLKSSMVGLISTVSGCSSNSESSGTEQGSAAADSDDAHPTAPDSLQHLTSVENGWVGPTPPEVQPHGVLAYNSGTTEYRLNEETHRDGERIYQGSGIPLHPDTYLIERLTVPATYRYKFWSENVEVQFTIDESRFAHDRSATLVEFTDDDAYVRTANGVDWYSLLEKNTPTRE